jgi:hypothetical protein
MRQWTCEMSLGLELVNCRLMVKVENEKPCVRRKPKRSFVPRHRDIFGFFIDRC